MRKKQKKRIKKKATERKVFNENQFNQEQNHFWCGEKIGIDLAMLSTSEDAGFSSLNRECLCRQDKIVLFSKNIEPVSELIDDRLFYSINRQLKQTHVCRKV